MLTIANTWIIGGTSGIGKEIAYRLQNCGHQIYVSDEAECDVTNSFAVHKYIEGLPRLANVVFSAGRNHLFHLGTGVQSAYAEVIDVNLTGFINVIDALVELYPSDPLTVLAIGSDAAVRPMRTSIAYCASKAGLHMAVKCAARELAGRGWQVNAIAPGMTHGTGMQRYIDATVPELRGWTEEEALAYEKTQEVVPGRVYKNEIATVAADMLTWPIHVNGEIVFVNGGR